jgi:hypothetical protein
MITASPASLCAPQRTSVSLVGSIDIAGLLIGLLGGAEGSIFELITKHTSPVLDFQYIASALLGPTAFAGGYATALVGALLHFGISFVVAAVFILAARWIALVRRTVFASAPLYGVAVTLFMNGLVVPLSLAPKLPVTTLILVHGLIAGAVTIGLPLAIIVARSGRAQG